MKRILSIIFLVFCISFRSFAWSGADSLSVAITEEDILCLLEEEGFANIRVSVEDDMIVVALENDAHKIAAEAIQAATVSLRALLGDDPRPVKLIAVHVDVPELTVTYDPESARWTASRKLDESWKRVQYKPRTASSLYKVDVDIYPQLSLKNLIINQVYQALWQASPSVEVSLWQGMKLSYQLILPIYNDGYGILASKVHPGMITLSQRFRDPWNLNINGKITAGVFSNNRFGVALEMIYYFPNERFSIDTQLAMLGNCYFNGFDFLYDPAAYFRWNVAFNFYMPMLDTQFTLRLQRFLLGDLGVKYEMIRHFNHCSVGLYAEKSQQVDFNAGFRFQIALPPFRHARKGYRPRVSISPNMGMAYNANNEQYYYREFKTEASDNIMSKNAFNPLHVQKKLN